MSRPFKFVPKKTSTDMVRVNVYSDVTFVGGVDGDKSYQNQPHANSNETNINIDMGFVVIC